MGKYTHANSEHEARLVRRIGDFQNLIFPFTPSACPLGSDIMMGQERDFERFSTPNSVFQQILIVMANTQCAYRNLGDVDAIWEDYVPPIKNDYLLHFNLTNQRKHLGVVIDVDLFKAIARVLEAAGNRFNPDFRDYCEKSRDGFHNTIILGFKVVAQLFFRLVKPCCLDLPRSSVRQLCVKLLPTYTQITKHAGGGATSNIMLANLCMTDGVAPRHMTDVAVKYLRTYAHRTQIDVIRRLTIAYWREALIWGSCEHRNIVPLLGLLFDTSCEQWGIPGLVSNYYRNGTIMQYLDVHQDKDRLKLLYQIACGLHYLHSQEPMIIHRDIKGANILIDDSGVALIGDFGCARLDNVVSRAGVLGSDSEENCGSIRWMAPELLMPMARTGEGEETIERHSTASDVWAFGMTALEILTSDLPFTCIRNDGAVLMKIVDGGIPLRPHPPRSRFVLDCVWVFLKRCWEWDPKARPNMEWIKNTLHEECIDQDQHFRGCTCPMR